MKRYVLTPSAMRDVNDIWNYIASDNLEAADRRMNCRAVRERASSPAVN